jgi:hypothetical protein
MELTVLVARSFDAAKAVFISSGNIRDISIVILIFIPWQVIAGYFSYLNAMDITYEKAGARPAFSYSTAKYHIEAEA